MKVIDIRRSVRKFSDQKVEADKIEKLLRAAMQAPSAANQQPWEFVVVQGKEKLEALSKMSPYATPIAKAPLAVVMMANKERLKFPENWEQDMSAATQNLLLEAVKLDLGSVWLGVAPLEDIEEHVAKVLKLTDTYKPFAVIALGYPASADANKFVDRFDVTRVHQETL